MNEWMNQPINKSIMSATTWLELCNCDTISKLKQETVNKTVGHYIDLVIYQCVTLKHSIFNVQMIYCRYRFGLNIKAEITGWSNN